MGGKREKFPLKKVAQAAALLALLATTVACADNHQSPQTEGVIETYSISEAAPDPLINKTQKELSSLLNGRDGYLPRLGFQEPLEIKYLKTSVDLTYLFGIKHWFLINPKVTVATGPSSQTPQFPTENPQTNRIIELFNRTAAKYGCPMTLEILEEQIKTPQSKKYQSLSSSLYIDKINADQKVGVIIGNYSGKVDFSHFTFDGVYPNCNSSTSTVAYNLGATPLPMTLYLGQK